MLELSGISRVYRTAEVETTALDRINLTIGAGEYVAITGPSGCGKTTLLSVIGLLDAPQSGSYRLGGQETTRLSSAARAELRRSTLGFVFQAFNLIDDLSVSENIELPLKYARIDRAERQERVQQVMKRLGVDHRGRHRPSQLSGGQQQRVAIARALVVRPAVLLADEPTGNLDTQHGDEVIQTLEEVNRQGTTLLLVTHAPERARRAGRIVELLDGRVVADSAASRPMTSAVS